MSDYDFSGAFKALGALCVAGGVALCGATWGLTALFNHYTAETPLAELSAGRQQLLNDGFAGTRRDLQLYLAAKTDEYFAAKGFPCDPNASSKQPAETLARARCAQPAPGRR
jgi:hypothetical protein